MLLVTDQSGSSDKFTSSINLLFKCLSDVD